MIGDSFLVLFLTLATLGTINAGFLTWKHFRKQPMICPLNTRCDIVTKSKWSHTFGIPNDVLGLLFFIGIIIATIVGIFRTNLQSTIRTLLILGESGALLFSIFLTYIQVKVIKEYCFYCLASALITLLLFVNSFFLFR